MRHLNQISNLRGIFDCFNRGFGKVAFNLKLSNLSDSEVASHMQLILDKFGTCEIRRLNCLNWAYKGELLSMCGMRVR